MEMNHTSEILTCDMLYGEEKDETIVNKVRKFAVNKFNKLQSFNHLVLLSIIRDRVPFSRWIITYPWREYLKDDFFSGLTVGVINIPQGLAYAMLAGLSSVYGLYVSFLAPIIYLLFGTSRHLSFGTFALLSLIVSSVIESDEILSLVNSTHFSFPENIEILERIEALKISAATTLAFLVGIIQSVLWMLRVGSLANFISPTVINAFSFGAMFHIVTSQVKYFFGIKPPSYLTRGYFSIFKIYFYYLSNIKKSNWVSLIIGSSSIILLMAMKYFEQFLQRYVKIPVPTELILIAITDGISYRFNFSGLYNVQVIGSIPTGFPPFTPPKMALVPYLITSSVILAIVSYSLNVSVAKDMAARNGNYEIDYNQEMFAYSICNIICSFFGCFVSGSSISRTLVQSNSGKTQIASIFSALLILGVLLFLAFIFAPLPNVVLAAIITVAFRSTFLRILTVPKIWNESNKEGMIWIFTVICVVCTNVQIGLLASVLVNMLWMLKTVYCSPVRFLKPALHANKFSELSTIHVISIEKRMICVFQWQGPIFYPSNAKLKSSMTSIFTNHLDLPLSSNLIDSKCNSVSSSKVGLDCESTETKIEESNSDQFKQLTEHASLYVIFDFSRVSYIDFACIETIFKIRSKLKMNQLLLFCGTSVEVYRSLKRYVTQKSIDDITFFLTHDDAMQYISKHVFVHEITNPDKENVFA